MSSLARLPGETFEDWIARVTVATEKRVEPSFDADLLPDAGYTPSPENVAIDNALSGIDIVDAYIRWCNKSTIKVGSKTEGIKVSCPNPDHPDKHPSAWITTSKGDGGVGTCGSCGIGFDKYDIYAWNKGLPVPGYKTKFAELKKNMAIDLGYSISVSAGTTVVDAPEPEPEESLAPVVELFTSDEEIERLAADPFEPPFFNWRDLPAIKPETFLHTWLTITSESEEPEEYYTWLGMQALGLAVGNNITLMGMRPYRANLMLCLVGPPAVGKSTTVSELSQILYHALPFKRELGNTGSLVLQQMASGEALMDALTIEIEDPTTKVKTKLPVRSLVQDAELAALIGRSNRNGNPLKESIQSFYDFSSPISSMSRTAGFREVRDHFVSFVTTTQQDRIEDLLKNKDEASGFISRWLFVYGKPKKRSSWRTERIDTEPCVELLRKVRAWGATERVVDFHDDATLARWNRFFTVSLNPVVEAATSSSMARLDLLCRKILLLFAINDRSTTILLEHIQSLEMLWPYILQGYGTIHDAISIDPLRRLMDRIEVFVGKFFERTTKWPTRRDIGKGFPAKQLKDFEYALDALVRDGRIVEITVKPGVSGGRPTTRYRLASPDDPTTTYMTV